MNFRYQDLNKELFDKVVAFSYSIGSGLGGPGAIIMLTRDGKEYFIGQEGFEGDWLHPANTFPFMEEAFNSKEIRDTLNGENVKLILCHYPILMWKEQHYGSILLYGHVHNSVEEYYFKKYLREMNTEEFFDRRRGDKVLRAYNVGCMLPYMNYEPRTLEEIVMESERLCNEQKL